MIDLCLARAEGAVMVSFSGGRDSAALAILARLRLPSIPLVYQDTGLAAPALLRWIRRMGGRHLVHLPPAVDPETTWRTGALPIGAKVSARAYRRQNPELRIDPSQCCKAHKANPMNAWLKAHGCGALLNGARGDDSVRHAFKLQYGEIIRTPHGWLLGYPLLTWQQQDTLAFLREHCPQYPLKYARNEELGCRACAINLARWPNQLARLRRADPDYHRHLIVDCAFGLEILMIRYGLTRKGAGQLVGREGWDRLIDEGHLDRIPQARRGIR